MGEFIELKASDRKTFRAYGSQPAVPPKGAIVVLQEIFGVNPHIRAVADDYAAEGYFVIAPDLFQRVKAGVETGYGPDDLSKGLEIMAAVDALPGSAVMRDIQAAIDHAAGVGKVGIVGYCWGGLLSWRSACELSGLSAAVTYYGGGMTEAPWLDSRPNCPVLAQFGEQDQWIPMSTVSAFAKAHPGVEVKTYNAGHGFNCDQRGSYDKDAAKLARSRSLAFFEKHLR